MAGIKSKDTKPEMILRRCLHARGFRFRLHRRDLPGCPDIVLRKYRAVIFVHGCFWHGHDCALFKWPKTREAFWSNKLAGNKARDSIMIRLLLTRGWRVATVWECSLKGRHKRPAGEVADICREWLASSDCELNLEGEISR